VVLLLLGVLLRAAAVLREGVIVPLPLLLPDGLGGTSGTFGCVSVSDSAACSLIRPLLILLLLLLLLLVGVLKPPRLEHTDTPPTCSNLCDKAALRRLLVCILDQLLRTIAR